VHIVGPEQGITQPGTTIACGDSHTSTHGAFGAIAFGIGTSQVRDVLATQTMALGKLKVRRIKVNGKLRPGVYAKDVILHIIRQLGVNGGTGYAYEYAGDLRPLHDGRAHDRLQHVHRGRRARRLRQPRRDHLRLPQGPPLLAQGRRVGCAVAALEVLRERPGTPSTTTSSRSDAADIAADRHLGHQSRPGHLHHREHPEPGTAPPPTTGRHRGGARLHEAAPGQPIKGTKIDVAFLGSCTNGRLSDFREVAKYIKGRKVAPA
jgi:3-isopropylmalate/(R)-2-methylmalate dehydratase large subunit